VRQGREIGDSAPLRGFEVEVADQPEKAELFLFHDRLVPVLEKVAGAFLEALKAPA